MRLSLVSLQRLLSTVTGVLLIAACGSEPGAVTTSSPPRATSTVTTEAQSTTTALQVVTTTTVAREDGYEDFDTGNFDESSIVIDNEWLPLLPGTQWVYEGVTIEDGEEIPHRVETAVTDLTKVIGDVGTVVIWELDYSDGQLVEAEIALFAQDVFGTVWHLGQYPEVYEDGKLVEAPAWIAGFEEARPGITMKAEPQLGTPSYSQGWGPAVDWFDRGQVTEVDQKTCVAFGCYEGVLVIDESDEPEPAFFQTKYYVRGVGNVRVGFRGPDPEQETLELVNLVQLDQEAMAQVRADVLEMEKRAFAASRDLYGQTLAMENRPVD